MSEDLIITKANLEDFPSLLELSKGIYFGLDYVPHCYKDWIQREEQFGDRFNLGKYQII